MGRSGFSLYVAAKKLRNTAERAARRMGARQFFADHGWAATMPAIIPRKLWIYWDTGLDGAPEMVRACVRRWQEANPEWDINILDRDTAPTYVSMPQLPSTIGKAHYADVLRTRLLAIHGGVWADGTTWCAKPLDDWLPPACQAGFFVHVWIDGDREYNGRSHPRILGNWFIAAAPGNSMITAWDRMTCDYWQGRRATNNYFWHNDIVEYLLRTDKACRTVWCRMPKYGAMAPHLVQAMYRFGGDEAAIRQAIAAGSIPVHKLNWRIKVTMPEIEDFILSAMQLGQSENASAGTKL